MKLDTIRSVLLHKDNLFITELFIKMTCLLLNYLLDYYDFHIISFCQATVSIDLVAKLPSNLFISIFLKFSY